MIVLKAGFGSRPGYKSLRKISLPGDTIIPGDDKCLGTKSEHAEKNVEELSNDDLNVKVLKPEPL